MLGSTGSIGTSTLDVVRHLPERLHVVGLACHAKWEQLADQCRAFEPRIAVLTDPAAFEAADRSFFPKGTELLYGDAGVRRLASDSEVDVVVSAVVGAAGLSGTWAALDAGKDVALANKETLVVAGPLVTQLAATRGAKLLPVDSEHSAIFQAIGSTPTAAVARIVLTASGGPFRGKSAADLERVGPEEALRHPTWQMGPKITVDSATLANKGLELIEAQWLFNLRAEQCQAVLHSQSIAHCLVEFVDGTMLAQLSPPSMTFPIQRALLHPQVVPGVESPLGLDKVFSLDFRPVDESRFPLFRLAREVMQTGGTAPAIYNAANEVAVAAFLDQKLPFLAISSVVEHTLRDGSHFEPASLSEVLAVDTESREIARRMCNKLAR